MTDDEKTLLYVSIHFELHEVSKLVTQFLDAHRHTTVSGFFLNKFLIFEKSQKFLGELYKDMTATADKAHAMGGTTPHSTEFEKGIKYFYHYLSLGWVPDVEEQNEFVRVANEQKEKFRKVLEKYADKPMENLKSYKDVEYLDRLLYLRLLGIQMMQNSCSYMHKKYLINLKSAGHKAYFIESIMDVLPSILEEYPKQMGISDTMVAYYKNSLEDYKYLPMTIKLDIGKSFHAHNTDEEGFKKSIKYLYGRYIKKNSKTGDSSNIG